MRLGGDGTCSMAGTNTKRATDGRVMHLTFEGGGDCGLPAEETPATGYSFVHGADCEWTAEADEHSAEATLYEFTCGKTQDDAKFTLANINDTAAYLDADAKAGKFALRFDREVVFGRVLASRLDNQAHAAGTLSLHVRSVGAIPKDGEVIATFADPGIVEADWEGPGDDGQVSDRLSPAPSYVTVGITPAGALEMKAVYAGETVCHSESPVPKNLDLRLNNGHWHHVVFVVDAEHADGDVLTVYIDGFSFPLHCVEGDAAAFNFQKAPAASLSAVYIGAAVVAGDGTVKVTRALQGEIDSVAFFNRALSKSEVSFLAADMPCAANSIGGSGYAYFAGDHADQPGDEWIEFDVDACLDEAAAAAKTVTVVTVAFHYLHSSAPEANFSLSTGAAGNGATSVVRFHSRGSAANDHGTWVDTIPVVLRSGDDGFGGKVRLSRRAPSGSRLGQAPGELDAEAAAFIPAEDHAGPAIDVAFVSSGAAFFTHRDLDKGGLKQAFTAYEYIDECHLFELTTNMSAAAAACVGSTGEVLRGGDANLNLFQRVSAHVLIDFKGQWFFKADGGNAFAVSIVIANDDGTVVVDRTEYFTAAAADSTIRPVLEQAVTLAAGTYSVQMFALYGGDDVGAPSLMYKNPTPCGVNAWRSFDSKIQMECINPLDAASNMGDEDESTDNDDGQTNGGTPTDATAVSPYTGGDAEDADAALGVHPARRLLAAASGDEALPNQQNPSAGLPITKDYEGMFFSMHLGVRLSAEFLEGLNDNYLAVSGSMRFLSFPGMSVELAIIPTQGLSMAFHFKINVWEILSGIVDLIVSFVITFVSNILGLMHGDIVNVAAGGGVITQALTKAVDYLKEQAKKLIKSITNLVLAALGLKPSDLKRIITELGFDGDAFEMMGSIDITPLDIGKMATFDMKSLPTATVVIKMSPHGMNNLIAVMVTMVKSIMYALAAPTLIAVDVMNSLLLGTKKWLVKAENVLQAARNALSPARNWLNQKQAELNSWNSKVQAVTNQYYAYCQDANMYCGLVWRACYCWGWYYLCNCGWRGCSWCYTSSCIYCLYENPSGCIGRKAAGVWNAAWAWAEIAVRTALYWIASRALDAAKAVLRVAQVLIDVILRIVQFAKKAVDWVYSAFKLVMTPLVGICDLLKVNCMVSNELNTGQLWGLFKYKPFTLFKVEYFLVSGTFDPQSFTATYSFKMPVTVWNQRYDLHGSFVLDPAQLVESFFVMCWKFVEGIFKFVFGASAAASAALGGVRATGAPLSIYPARASAAAALGHAEVDAYIARALGVARAGRFGVISANDAVLSPGALGGDWEVGVGIHAEEDFFAFAAHESATADLGSRAGSGLHAACAVALREHATQHAQDADAADGEEALACAAAGAAAARYCSAASWSGDRLHEAEAACTHAIGALSYIGIDSSMSQPAVCGGSAALASGAGACVAAALEELSCSAGCAAALTALPGVCGGMVPRRGGLRDSRECSHALTAAQRTCSAGGDAARCVSLLSAVPPVEVRQHAAALAQEGGFGMTMLSSIDWSHKVGRCRLTLSKPELTARLVSALETIM